MGLASTEQIIQEFLANNWSDTPFSYEGMPHRDLSDPAEGLLENGDKDFIIFNIQIDRSQVITVPGTCKRRYGFISADIYTKEDTGDRQAKTYIDGLNALLEYKTLSGKVRVKNLLDDGLFEANGWAIHACQWPFETED